MISSIHSSYLKPSPKPHLCNPSQRPTSFHPTNLLPNSPLETLLRNLSLGSSNDLSGIRISETASSLSILLTSCLSRADTKSSRRDFRAARRAAIRVGNATASDELCTLSSAHVLGAGCVGSDLCEGSGRD